MNYLRHSWFDPTTLSSRSVEWSILTGRSEDDELVLQAFRAALLAEHDSVAQPSFKRRGRQRACAPEVPMRRYPEDLAASIGVLGNSSTVQALYCVKVGAIPVALTGVQVDKNDKVISGSLDAIYVSPAWRRRGLATSIAQHAGEWMALAMNSWRDCDQSLHAQVCSLSSVEASLAVSFFRTLRDTAHLHGLACPLCRWSIVGD